MDRRSLLVLAIVWGTLMALLGATIAVTMIGFGSWNPVFNLAIAGAKTVLIAWFFMHLRTETPVTRLAAAAVLFWLIILFALSLSDWLTRSGS